MVTFLLPKSRILCRFIGWLKNFITDRNSATENLVDSYTSATLVRRAPHDVRTALEYRWSTIERAHTTTRSFLVTADTVLKRSRERGGQHLVQINLAPHNCRLVRFPHRDTRLWFEIIEPGLLVYELNGRTKLRKNGVAVTEKSYVSYDNGAGVQIGVITSILVGCRVAMPYDAGCALCNLRSVPASRVHNVNNQVGAYGNLLVVDKHGEDYSSELVCCTKLKHRYVRALWDADMDDRFALLRYEAY